MGLLDFNLDDPTSMGLLSAGLNMIGNSGRGSGMSTGAILANGAGAGFQGAQGVRDGRTHAELLKRKLAEDDLHQQQLKLQTEGMLRKNAMEDSIRGVYKDAYSAGGRVDNPNWSFKDAKASAEPQFIDRPAGLDLQSIPNKLMGVGAFQEGLALKKQLMGENYKLSKDETLYGADNKVIATGVQSAPKNELKEGYITQDASGKWVVDPVLFDAHLKGKQAGATSVNVGKDNLGLKPADRFNMEGKLSDDYRAETKTDQGVLSAASKIKASLSKDGALADQAAIYSFAKILDPDGAVREADYAAIMNTAGLADRVRNYVQKLQTGEQLSATQRKEMLDVMGRFETVANSKIATTRGNYSERAKSYNLEPSKLFMDASKGLVAKPKAEQSPQKTKVIGNKTYVFDGTGWSAQ